ncbi:hypothetical protein HK098_004064 [Nowakowskiella sp. JEL0407]|nr:hypothetical protein HK098_004064 [Nowakowskiella sp. JEL0407]
MKANLLIGLAIALISSVSAQCVARYGQCGGQTYTEFEKLIITKQTACCSGSTCKYINDYYSQCVEGSATSPVAASPVKSPAKSPATSLSSGGGNTGGGNSASIPNKFSWTSSGVLINPKSDSSHKLASVKDPSIVYYNGKYHAFVTTADSNGNYNMAYLSFSDWSQADSAAFTYLDKTPVGSGYKTAPQIFYHTPSQLWYLVYQTGSNAMYNTNKDISNPQGWSTGKTFYSGMPQIVKNNIGKGNWLDFWVICDSSKCHLFSSDDNGHLYRSETSLNSFPSGFSQPVIVLSDSNPYALFEASNIYSVKGTGKYLLVVEAIGSNGRYFRGWTSSSISGPFTPISGANSEATPFAGYNNVNFNGNVWTKSISSGGLIPDTYDQTMTISPCNMRFVIQGLSPTSTESNYNKQPWKIGMLTQKGC